MNIFNYNKLKEIGYDSIVFECNDKSLDKISFIYQNLYKDNVYYLTDSCPIHKHEIEDIKSKKILLYRQYYPNHSYNEFYDFVFDLSYESSNLLIIYLTEQMTTQLINHSSLYISSSYNEYNVLKDRYDFIKDMDFSEVDMMERNLKIDILCQ